MPRSTSILVATTTLLAASALTAMLIAGGGLLAEDELPEIVFMRLAKEYDELSRNRDYMPERRRGEILQLIGKLDFDSSRDPKKLRKQVGQFLGKALEKDSSERVKVRALMALGALSDAALTKGMWAFAEGYVKKDSLYFERLPDAMALNTDEESADFILKKKLLSSKPVMRQIAAEALGNMKCAAAVDPLIQLIADKEFAVRYEAIVALGKIGEQAAIQPLVDRLADKDGRIREAAAFSLGELKAESALGELYKLMDADTEAIARESAVMAIRAIGSRESVEPLISRVSQEPMVRIKERITATLREITAADITAYDTDIWRSWWEVNKGKTREEIEAGQTEEELPDTQRSVVKYYDIDVLSNRVVFILDVSCSMEWGNRIRVVKDEFYKTLDQLDDDTMFDIVRFASDYRSWTRDANILKKETGKAGTSLIKATKEHKAQAREWVDKLLPGGGTNTYETIEDTFNSYPDVDTIYFLSDGAPSLGRYKLQEKILAEFKKMNRYRKVQIHSIAVLVGKPKEDWGATGQIFDDKGVCVDFMRRLAAENRGQFVLRGDPEDDELLTEEEKAAKEAREKGDEKGGEEKDGGDEGGM